MENILKNLSEIGVSDDVITAIRENNDLESALLMLMNDDRHEYV